MVMVITFPENTVAAVHVEVAALFEEHERYNDKRMALHLETCIGFSN